MTDNTGYINRKKLYSLLLLTSVGAGLFFPAFVYLVNYYLSPSTHFLSSIVHWHRTGYWPWIIDLIPLQFTGIALYSIGKLQKFFNSRSGHFRHAGKYCIAVLMMGCVIPAVIIAVQAPGFSQSQLHDILLLVLLFGLPLLTLGYAMFTVATSNHFLSIANKGIVSLRHFFFIFISAWIIAILLPLMMWTFDIIKNDLSFSLASVKHIHSENKLYWLFDITPLLICFAGSIAGIWVNNKIIVLRHKVINHEEGMNRVRLFAEKIGEGELDAEYDLVSKDDTLGAALVKMRDNLRQSAQSEHDRQWTMEGIARLGDVLMMYPDVEELSYHVIVFLVKKIGVIQGAFYIVEEDAGHQAVIRMISSYAYNRKKYLHREFRIGEGLVGQAAIERDFIYRTDLPSDYATITSGLLGDAKPSSLLIVPLIANDMLYGVVELAGIRALKPLEIDFVKEVSEVIAQTIFNLGVNEKTARLLDEVNKSQKRMQALLENASEVITIYEEDMRIRYISPSVEHILGYRSEEMIGIRDTIYIHPKGVGSFEKMFQDILDHPAQTYQTQFSYFRKDGERIWMEATGKNLLGDPAIRGIVVNTRDITMRLRAEKEEKKSGQMQALSENSPDLIMRIDIKGMIFYINPVIERFTGNSPLSFVHRNIREVGFDTGYVELLEKLLRTMPVSREKYHTETTYQTPYGKRIMSISAIPELNGEQVVETILIVAHDITEAKLIEQEIQEKNKKITESINYAERIQRAILTNEDLLYACFPDSFMLFKPRDLVSGDFPWVHLNGDDIYVAVVDCTGHGVPGALMSLIGHFILNECVSHHEPDQPSVLLDNLHIGVKRTLKQEENAESRDGMDIAMCRINRRKKELQYAGAHRPLYHIRDGILTEIKGDKYPIGGVQYDKKRQPFTNHTLRLEEGDMIYFFSDGYPDQVGGPEGRKFMVGRIQELLTRHHGLSTRQVCKVMSDAFDEWKGSYKQVDDVLVIGIRF